MWLKMTAGMLWKHKFHVIKIHLEKNGVYVFKFYIFSPSVLKNKLVAIEIGDMFVTRFIDS